MKRMSSLKKGEQNEISHAFLEGSDLLERERGLLEVASRRLGFEPTDLMGRSAWWGSSQVGAVFYSGIYDAHKAVLKIQGVKPATSEILMIREFAKNNKSNLVRPPVLYAYSEWDEDKRYEALVTEFIEGEKIINQLPAGPSQIQRFFEIYRDYRENCLTNPWLEKPSEGIGQKISESFRQMA